jgi:hypothetical protein
MKVSTSAREKVHALSIKSARTFVWKCMHFFLSAVGGVFVERVNLWLGASLLLRGKF